MARKNDSPQKAAMREMMRDYSGIHGIPNTSKSTSLGKISTIF